MNYDEFIYKMIKLLMSWGTWNDSIELFFGGHKYLPCDNGAGKYKDLNNVMVTEMAEEEIAWSEGWPEGTEININLNGQLVNMFDSGILVTDLGDMSFYNRTDEYLIRSELQDEFRDTYDREEIMIRPEDFDLPSELEFDSADEYAKFIETEIERAEQEYIRDLSGEVECDNILEVEIAELCNRYELSYIVQDANLLIGHEIKSN